MTIKSSCTNCYRDYVEERETCDECGGKRKAHEEKPEPPRAQIIDLCEALKQSLEGRK